MSLRVFLQISLILLTKFTKSDNDIRIYPFAINLNTSDKSSATKEFNTEITKVIRAETRIINGYLCKISQHPYIVNIVRTKSLRHHCGGSLITSEWILTAAHCGSENYKPGHYSAIAGLTDTPRYRMVQEIIFAQISRIIKNQLHPVRAYDIGLMQLERPFKESKVVRFVRLATPADTASRALEDICNNSTILGWGHQYAKDAEGEPLSTPKPPHDHRLQCVHIPVVSKKECSDQYGRHIFENLICAFAPGKDSCQGDSGGPLMCHGKQYGIVSSGRGCAYKRYPGLYERVDMHDNFIRDTVYKSCAFRNSYKCASSAMFVIYYTGRILM